MLNIKTASFAQLKQFASENNLIIEGDKRLRATWEKAVELFQSTKEAAVELAQETIEGAAQCVREVATYDNAVVAANAFYTWTCKTLRFIGSVFLVTVALICIGIDLWQNRGDAKEVLVSVYRRQASRAKDRWVALRKMGDAVFWWHVTERIQSRIVSPVINYRDRIWTTARLAAK
jgi:hypothetical protein